MPRFFIDIFDGRDLVPDELGIECADLEDAREEALIAARDHLANMIKEGKPIAGYVFRILDDRRFVVAKLDAAEVIAHLPYDIPKREIPHPHR
jgi:hypothetical protein